MDVTLYPDEDWTVDVTHATDVSAVTLTDAHGGETVRIEGSYKVLAALAATWTAEMGATSNDVLPTPVLSAPYKTRTTTLDEIDAKIDNLETLLDEHHGGEERRYPDDFTVGDWFQVPPSKVWRKIDRVAEHPMHTQRQVSYTYGGTTYVHDLRAQTRYPYMATAAMAAVPKQEA